MYDRRTFAKLAGATVLLGAGPKAVAAPSPSGRAAEAATLVRFAEQTHPRGREAKADLHWRRLADRLIASAGAPVAEYVVRAFELLAWFKDGHTTLWAGMLDVGPFGLDMPVRVGSFYDGLYVAEASPGLGDLLGARLTAVAGVPVNQLMHRFAAVWPANNLAWPHHDAGLLFTTPGLLHGLGIVGGADERPIAIEAVSGNGQPIRRQLIPAKTIERVRLTRTQWPRERWAAEAGSSNYVRRLSDERALYVSLEDLGQPEDQFLAFVRQVFAAMDEPAWSKLILDLRRNPGGNNFLGEPLRKHIERSRFNRPGAFYVLTSPVTFSAAQNLANRLERETFATFAGEPTGGAPNHYGDAKPFQQGHVLHGGVSTLPWFDSYPVDKRPWIMPDMLIPRAFADWAGGHDKVLDAVLADDRRQSADDTSNDRTFYFSRKSQSQEWKPFWASS
jgi:hypothetical protein